MSDDVTYECLECGDRHDDIEDARVCCYTNEDCPESCSTEHNVPQYRNGMRSGLRGSAGRMARFVCPETDDGWRWCDYCDEWDQDRYGEGSTLINGQWVCDPYEHDFAYCERCEEWRDSDDIEYDEWGDDSRCSQCARQRRTPQPKRCSHCSNAGTVFAEADETFRCLNHVPTPVKARVAA